MGSHHGGRQLPLASQPSGQLQGGGRQLPLASQPSGQSHDGPHGTPHTLPVVWPRLSQVSVLGQSVGGQPGPTLAGWPQLGLHDTVQVGGDEHVQPLELPSVEHVPTPRPCCEQ